MLSPQCCPYTCPERSRWASRGGWVCRIGQQGRARKLCQRHMTLKHKWLATRCPQRRIGQQCRFGSPVMRSNQSHCHKCPEGTAVALTYSLSNRSPGGIGQAIWPAWIQQGKWHPLHRWYIGSVRTTHYCCYTTQDCRGLLLRYPEGSTVHAGSPDR